MLQWAPSPYNLLFDMQFLSYMYIYIQQARSVCGEQCQYIRWKQFSRAGWWYVWDWGKFRWAEQMEHCWETFYCDSSYNWVRRLHTPWRLQVHALTWVRNDEKCVNNKRIILMYIDSFGISLHVYFTIHVHIISWHCNLV